LPAKKRTRKARSPGDYEAELVRLCKGNRREAERMIVEEQQRSPALSRQGAALALVTRIRHERSPRRPRL
jgi:excinuclease UvrABC nuclease subunit